MALRFPPEVQAAARRHHIPTALAFGLGEGLNLYYGHRPGALPPHRLHVLPLHFEATLERRLAQKPEEAIAAALAGNGYGMMVCTGDWHGLDAIEKWGEELSRWPLVEEWESSTNAAVTLIDESDGLYRRSYAAFLEEAMLYYDGLETARQQLIEIADDWLNIGIRLRAGADLERVSSHILRMASRESRFWALILDRFGKGI